MPAAPFDRAALSSIVVAVNATDAEPTARFAISLVRGRPARELTFCHVIDVMRMFARAAGCPDDYSLLLTIAKEEARATLDRCCLLAREAGVFARACIRYGDPASASCTFAERHRAGLIVIGNGPRRAGNWDRLVHGNMLVEMARQTTIPVLVADLSRARPSECRPSRILIVGADSRAERAVKLGAEFARENDTAKPLLRAYIDGSRSSMSALRVRLRDLRPDLVIVSQPLPRSRWSIFEANLVDRILHDVAAPVAIAPTRDVVRDDERRFAKSPR
jgi:nucleotide-binding universal stress UspA family protein